MAQLLMGRKFIVDDLVKAGILQPHQPRLLLGLADGHRVAHVEAEGAAAVHREEGIAPPQLSHPHGDGAPGRGDDALGMDGMGADGGDDDILRRGLHNGAASGHGVGRGAGGRADNDAVAGEGRGLHAVALHRELNHPGNGALVMAASLSASSSKSTFPSLRTVARSIMRFSTR